MHIPFYKTAFRKEIYMHDKDMITRLKAAIVYTLVCTLLFFGIITFSRAYLDFSGVGQVLPIAIIYLGVTLGGVLLIVRLGVITSPIRSGAKNVSASKRFMTEIASPIVIFNGDMNAEWGNSAALEQLVEVCDKSVNLRTGFGVTEDMLLSPEGCEIRVGDTPYKVQACKTDTARGVKYHTLWHDISTEQHLKARLEKEKLAVASVIIDMSDDYLGGLGDKYADAAAEVTDVLRAWADKYCAMFEETESGRFVVLMSEESLREIKQTSFGILNEVKNISHSDSAVPMTVSMGVATGDMTLQKKYKASRDAMEFALRRGGDQVVIRGGGADVFFGGIAKHDPPLVSLRARRLVAHLCPLVEASSSVFVMGHKNADYDCLAACVGIAKICQSLKADVGIIIGTDDKNIQKPISRMMSQARYSELFIDEKSAMDKIDPDTLLIVVDVNNPFIFASTALAESVNRYVIIDHHRKHTSELKHKPLLNFIEPHFSSASEIVAQMIEQFLPTGTLTAFEAELMLAGIMLDTNNFTRNCGTGTYAAAQFLRHEGADSERASAYFDMDQEQYRTELEIKRSFKEPYLGKYAICVSGDARPVSDTVSTARIAEDMLKLDGISASFALCRIKTDPSELPVYAISARSDGSVNVQVILEKLGGGGHLSNAATQITSKRSLPILGGATLENADCDSILEILKSAINRSIEELPDEASGKERKEK